MRKAGEAIEALTSIHERSLSTDLPTPKVGICTDIGALVEIENTAAVEVREHISFQKRLCTSLMAAIEMNTPVAIDRVSDAIDDISCTTNMWKTLLSLNPRMTDYAELVEEADTEFKKFMSILASAGIILIVPLRDAQGNRITEVN